MIGDAGREFKQHAKLIQDDPLKNLWLYQHTVVLTIRNLESFLYITTLRNVCGESQCNTLLQQESCKLTECWLACRSCELDSGACDFAMSHLISSLIKFSLFHSMFYIFCCADSQIEVHKNSSIIVLKRCLSCRCQTTLSNEESVVHTTEDLMAWHKNMNGQLAYNKIMSPAGR